MYLPAIKGHVPEEIVSTLCAFLEFCYLVRRNVLTAKDLDDLDKILAWFYRYREIFKTEGVVTTFSLPRQHAMKHYRQLIQWFGAVRSGPSEGRGQRQPNNQHPSDCDNARRGPPKLR